MSLLLGSDNLTFVSRDLSKIQFKKSRQLWIPTVKEAEV